MRDFMMAAAALGDQNRIRILLALGQSKTGELCVCQITELLALAPSTVSKHLSILKQAQLVNARKQARWMYYCLPAKDAPPFVHEAVAWVRNHAALEPRAAADRKNLLAILKLDPEELCKRQLANSKSCSCAPATPAAAKWPKAGRKPSKTKRSKPTPQASNPTA